PASFKVGNNSFEGMLLDGRSTFLVQVQEGNLFVARTEQYTLAYFCRQLLEWGLDIKFVVGSQAGQQRMGERIAPVPAMDRTTGQAEVGESYDAFRIEDVDV